MTEPEKTGEKQDGRFKRGRSGNPAGRPRGSRNRATIAAEHLFDGEAEKLVRKAIELALDGNVLALRLCLDRLLPPKRGRSAPFTLPELHTPADASAALAAILSATATGDLTVADAIELAKLVDGFIRALGIAREAERKERSDRIFSELNLRY